MPVLLLGDSHLSRFAPYLRLIAKDCTLRAVSGSAASDLLDQLGDLDPSAYDVVVVSVGTNDCGVKPAPLDEFLASIQATLDRVRPTPVVLLNNPGADERAVGYDDAQMKTYAAEAADLVRAYGGEVVEATDVIAPLGLRGRTPDGLHPSKRGLLLLVPALNRAIRRARRRAVA